MIAGRRSMTWCSARVRAGRQASIAAAEEHVGPQGGRILEVGLGTGISLLSYRPEQSPRRHRHFGARCCAARRTRVVEHKLTNVEALAVMDAKHLAVPDASFDVVVAQYVITAVPDPEATLDEFVRVLKPGGEIILVNHLGAESGFRRAFEQGFSPIARRLGWSPEFPWERLTRWAERDGVRLIERRPMPPLGHFSLIRFGKRLNAAAREPDRVPASLSPRMKAEARMQFQAGDRAALLLLRGVMTAQAQPTALRRDDPKGLRARRESHLKMPDTPTPQAPQTPNATTGSGTNLSDKLAQSDGVLCPPNVDPEIKAPTPEVGKMPVIPPPGSPGGDPSVRPK